MIDKNLDKEDLLKIVERQEKIISNYEAVSGLYKKIKIFPIAGKAARMTAGLFKNGQGRATKVIDCVKKTNPEVIGVCNPNFRGVRVATYSITTDVVEVSEIFTQSEATRAAKKILGHSPKIVLLSGYPIGYDILAEELKKINPKVRIFSLIHSAFLWFDVFPDENQVFTQMLELEKRGVIEKIGFCKKDLAVYFRELGVNAYFVLNRFKAENDIHKLSKNKIKVGVWGQNIWHRNILNQVVAALSLPNTEVHVNEVGDFSFIDRKRIVVHGLLPKDEFDKVFQEMDINMYVSLTDCFPMTLIESMSYGIPALASDTSDVYSFDEKLKKMLTVSTIDGPIGISIKLKETLKNYELIQLEIKKYLPLLKTEVEKSITDFLE